MNLSYRVPRAPITLALLTLGLSGCLGEESTGPVVTDLVSRTIVYGIVRSPDGSAASGVSIQSFQYPIDRGTIEGGSCYGELHTGPSVVTGQNGRYRLEIDGFVGQGGSGCVRIVATPDEEMPAGAVTIEQNGMRYLLSTRDSARIDIQLPAAGASRSTSTSITP